MQAAGIDALTINEAAATTGWSARMLRYIEAIGLVQPRRSSSGYRLYGPEELQRLSSLRELLDENAIDLAEVGFARRLEREPALREAIEHWLVAKPARPEHVDAADWLRFEQEKHQRLLAESAPPQRSRSRDTAASTAAIEPNAAAAAQTREIA